VLLLLKLFRNPNEDSDEQGRENQQNHNQGWCSDIIGMYKTNERTIYLIKMHENKNMQFFRSASFFYAIC